MRNLKKKNLEKYYRIKIDIYIYIEREREREREKEREREYVFLFLLNFKTKYISQTPTINHIIYKTHKFRTFDLNIKIVIVIVI